MAAETVSASHPTRSATMLAASGRVIVSKWRTASISTERSRLNRVSGSGSGRVMTGKVNTATDRLSSHRAER